MLQLLSVITRSSVRAFLLFCGTLAAACADASIGDDEWGSGAPEVQGAAATDVAGRDGAAPVTMCDNPSPEVVTIMAPAPAGIAPHHLGRPLDENFSPIPGEEGRSLFVNDVVHTTKVHTIEHRITTIETTRAFKANVRAWVVSAGFGTSTTHRYASYNAHQVDEVREVDEATPMRQAPPGAVYYLWRLHYGHSFEMVVSGEDRSFTANVKATFMVASGGISAFAASNNLKTTALGRGLEPIDGQAIFATTAEEITRSYKNSGEAVPIFAEYRSIPRTCLPPDEQIHWRTPMRMRIGFDKLNVYEDGSLGSDTWSMEAKCTLNDKEVPLTDIEVLPRMQVSDSCTGGLAGPAGDDDYCPYDLAWAANLDVVDGDVVRCGTNGVEWDNGKTLPFSQFRYDVKTENAPLSNKFGTGANGLEYWVFYSLEFPKDLQAPQ